MNLYNLIINFFIFLFIFLFIISIIGFYLPPYSYPTSGHIKGYNYSIYKKDSLEKIIFYKSNKKKDYLWVRNINNLVYNTLVHGNHTELRFQNNWFLWVISKIYGKHLLFTQEPYFIIQSTSAICSQAVAVFNFIMDLNSVDSRFVSLNGHVVSEVKIDSRWFIFDPDFGVDFPFGVDELDAFENEALIYSKLRNNGFDNDVINSYLNITKKVIKFHEIGEAHEPKRKNIELLALFFSICLPIYLIIFLFVIKKFILYDFFIKSA
jgi:hypothetical protein